MSPVTRYLVIQDGLSDFIGRAISWLTIAMIGVLVLEIVARYFLDSPTIWAHETSTMLFGTFCMLAGSYTLRHRAHVRSEVIYGVLSKRGKAFCDTIIFALGLVVMGVFFSYAVDFAAESWKVKEFSNKSVWRPVLYPIKTVIPVAVGLVILQNIAELVRAVLVVVGMDFKDPREIEIETDIDPELLKSVEK